MHATPDNGAIATVAIDLAKDVFELAFADADARIVERRRLNRTAFARVLDNRPPLRDGPRPVGLDLAVDLRGGQDRALDGLGVVARQSEHDRDQADARDHGDERLAAPRHHVALGDRPFERGEDQAGRPWLLVVPGV